MDGCEDRLWALQTRGECFCDKTGAFLNWSVAPQLKRLEFLQEALVCTARRALLVFRRVCCRRVRHFFKRLEILRQCLV